VGTGTGLLILAADHVEVYGNTFRGNKTAGVGVFNLAFFLGGAVTVALVGAILRARETAGDAFNPLFDGGAVAYSDAMLVVVGFTLIGFVLSLLLGPSGARRGAATHFQYVFVDYVAEQVVIALVQPFGAPDEFTFRAVHAQKLAVGSVVIVGVGVPPRTAGAVAGT